MTDDKDRMVRMTKTNDGCIACEACARDDHAYCERIRLPFCGCWRTSHAHDGVVRTLANAMSP